MLRAFVNSLLHLLLKGLRFSKLFLRNMRSLVIYKGICLMKREGKSRFRDLSGINCSQSGFAAQIKHLNKLCDNVAVF